MTTPDPHPLAAARAQTRATLHALAVAYGTLLTPGPRSSGAEDTLRAVIGMEREAGMEMRIWLGDDAATVPYHRSAPLAEMRLPELLLEAGVTRRHTLAFVDRVLDTARTRPLRLWTLGEEVPPEVYLVALCSRLERLNAAVAAGREA